MIPQNIQKILKIPKWKEEEATASIHITSHLATCHLESKKAYNKKLWSVSIFSVINNYAHEWTSYEEAKKTFAWAFNKLEKDNQYFKRKKEKFLIVSKKTEDFFLRIRDNNLKSYSNRQLKKDWLAIRILGRMQYGYGIIAECLDVLEDSDYLRHLVNVPLDKYPDVLSVLTTPAKLTFFDYERLSLLNICLKIIKDGELVNLIKGGENNSIKQYPYFLRMLKTHVKNYFWIQNSFSRAVYLDEKYFIKTMADILLKKPEEIKKMVSELYTKNKRLTKEQDHICKIYNLAAEDIFFFLMIRDFTVFQDKRKENVQKIVFCIDKIITEIAHRRKVFKKELEKYTVDELVALVDHNKKLIKKKIKKRKTAIFVNYFEKNIIKEKVFFGKVADEIYSFLISNRKKLAKTNELKGFVASQGKGRKLIKGKVRIVFDPMKDKFKKGEILVTGMTRPEFVPLMKKASAIITNEGGITTHAAIISREMAIPCIIGTKTATEVLKDGYLVEVDVEKGIVRRLLIKKKKK